MSPRRSSRSKTSQPTSVTQHTSSSSSSVSSARTDRKSRPDIKLPSPRDSLPPKSPASEHRETSTKPQARRTRSSQEAPKIEAPVVQDDEELEEEDGEEEEEVTRCVCGQQEYPGMPIAPNNPTKAAAKSTGDSGDAASSATLQEDTGGLFIQCDVCKVWQHGGCVGIMDEAMSPEEYFCEQCRKDLHTITITATGQRHSNYLPVQDGSSLQPSPSPQPPNDSPKKSKDGRGSRLNAERLAGKRRSTMNSRDAAYYEAEQLRQAIEESKKDSTTGAGFDSRKGKRSRDESDQGKEDNKRQRTKSGSSSSSNEKRVSHDVEEEAEETNVKCSPPVKNIRGASARNHRSKEVQDLEDKRQKERADAAGRRKGRAEKRRGDESDPSEAPLSRTTSSKGAEQINVATPPTSQTQASQKGSHHKRTGRPPARRGRVGRNQWTRDRDPRPDAPKNPPGATSPACSHNSKEDRNSPRINGSHNHNGNGEGGKAAKSRYTNLQRTSMIEMKRRVAAMLEFINQAERELAVEVALVPSSRKTPSSGGATGDQRDRKDRNQLPEREGQTSEPQKAVFSVLKDLNPDSFKGLELADMRLMMRKVLLNWQKEFG
ncbi:MAG: hypothetical protein Q9182_001376 [Xanthomendoza sp. 2 TL-2023]